MDLPLNSILCGDSIQVMQKFPDNSVDTIITDPPYGYAICGKTWDAGVPRTAFWRMLYRKARPGATNYAYGPASMVLTEFTTRR